MATSKKKPSRSHATRNALILLGLFVVLLVYLYFFAQDYTGRRLGLAAVAIWIFGLSGAMFFTTVYIARFILPYRPGESWSEGLNMLVNNVTANLKGEKPLPTVDIQEDELPHSFGRLGAGILKSHQVLALYKGNSFTRPAGPGFVRLNRDEAIDEVIDLRVHQRKHDYSVNTRDGIPVSGTASVTFRVRQPEYVDDERVAFPYDRDAIFDVSRASSVAPVDDVQAWSEQIASQAAGYAVSEIAHYDLARLSSNTGDINKRVTHDLQETFKGEGIEIINAGVGGPRPPEDIATQHIQIWRANWQRRIMEQAALGDVEAARRLRRARARAQVEIIQTVVQSIEEMRRAGQTDLSNIVTLRMIEVLEQAMANNKVRGMIAEPMIKNMLQDTTLQMRAMLEPPRDDRGADNV